MLNINKNINVIGNITVEQGEVNVNVVDLNACIIGDTSNYNITTSVLNRELYKENKAKIQQEISEFYDYVESFSE